MCVIITQNPLKTASFNPTMRMVAVSVRCSDRIGSASTFARAPTPRQRCVPSAACGCVPEMVDSNHDPENDHGQRATRLRITPLSPGFMPPARSAPPIRSLQYRTHCSPWTAHALSAVPLAHTRLVRGAGMFTPRRSRRCRRGSATAPSCSDCARRPAPNRRCGGCLQWRQQQHATTSADGRVASTGRRPMAPSGAARCLPACTTPHARTIRVLQIGPGLGMCALTRAG